MLQLRLSLVCLMLGALTPHRIGARPDAAKGR